MQELARGVLSLWLAVSVLAACGDSGLDAPKVGSAEQTETTAEPSTAEAFVTILQKSAGAPVRYEFAERQTDSVEELGSWLVQVKQAADAAGVGVDARIHANNYTPAAEIVRVLEKFELAGIGDVEYFGGDPAISKNLPWPKSRGDKDRHGDEALNDGYRQLVDRLLGSGSSQPIREGSEFADVLRKLAQTHGWDFDECTKYDSGEGARSGRSQGPITAGRATLVRVEGESYVVVVLQRTPIGVPGISAQKLLLLDARGQLLDVVACGINSRYGRVSTKRLGKPDADGALFVMEFQPSYRGSWHNWHTITYGGKPYTFHEREQSQPSEWDRRGLCRVGVRQKKFRVVFPELKGTGG